MHVHAVVRLGDALQRTRICRLRLREIVEVVEEHAVIVLAEILIQSRVPLTGRAGQRLVDKTRSPTAACRAAKCREPGSGPTLLACCRLRNRRQEQSRSARDGQDARRYVVRIILFQVVHELRRFGRNYVRLGSRRTQTMKEPKTNVRSLMTGPPAVPPNSLRRKTGILDVL